MLVRAIVHCQQQVKANANCIQISELRMPRLWHTCAHAEPPFDAELRFHHDEEPPVGDDGLPDAIDGEPPVDDGESNTCHPTL